MSGLIPLLVYVSSSKNLPRSTPGRHGDRASIGNQFNSMNPVRFNSVELSSIDFLELNQAVEIKTAPRGAFLYTKFSQKKN